MTCSGTRWLIIQSVPSPVSLVPYVLKPEMAAVRTFEDILTSGLWPNSDSVLKSRSPKLGNNGAEG